MNEFLAIEIGLALMYIACLIYILKKDKNMVLFFVSSTFYALLFENMNILLSYDSTGGYYYNSNFRVFIGHLPLFVALAWSIIIYTSLKIASSLGLKKNSIPFAAALLVLLVDLAIDVVAIRLNYWFWIGYSFKEGYFGVPANNFIGWLLVSFTWFYFDQRFNPKKAWLKYFFMPFLSYFAFLTMFIFISFAESLFALDKIQQFIVLGLLLIGFLISMKKDKKATKIDYTIYLFRVPFYLFGILFLLKERMYEENVLLLLFSIIFIVAEVALILGEKNVFAKKDNK
jgi:uncharacterized membrane protein